MNDTAFAALAKERGIKLRQKTRQRRRALIAAATLTAALVLVFGLVRLTDRKPPLIAEVRESVPAAVDTDETGEGRPEEPFGEASAIDPTESGSRAREDLHAVPTTGEEEFDAPAPALSVYVVSVGASAGSASVAEKKLGDYPEDVAEDVKARLDALIAANQYNFTDAAGETGPGILLVFSTGESYTLLPSGTLIAGDDACTLSPDAVDGIYAALDLE